MINDDQSVTAEDERTVTVEEVKEQNPYRRPFLVLVLVICLSLLAQAIGSYQTWFVAHDTNTIVKDVNFRNSPEQLKQQQRVLNEIILRVDCNSRKAIEEALNQVEAENPGLKGSIDITTDLCADTEPTKNNPSDGG